MMSTQNTSCFLCLLKDVQYNTLKGLQQPARNMAKRQFSMWHWDFLGLFKICLQYILNMTVLMLNCAWKTLKWYDTMFMMQYGKCTMHILQQFWCYCTRRVFRSACIEQLLSYLTSWRGRGLWPELWPTTRGPAHKTLSPSCVHHGHHANLQWNVWGTHRPTVIFRHMEYHTLNSSFKKIQKINNSHFL